MTTCPSCKRPHPASFEEWDKAHCMWTAEYCSKEWPRMQELAALKATLAQAMAVVEAADELYDAANQGVLSYEHISVYSSRRSALRDSAPKER